MLPNPALCAWMHIWNRQMNNCFLIVCLQCSIVHCNTVQKLWSQTSFDVRTVFIVENSEETCNIHFKFQALPSLTPILESGGWVKSIKLNRIDWRRSHGIMFSSRSGTGEMRSPLNPLTPPTVAATSIVPCGYGRFISQKGWRFYPHPLQ